MSQASKQTVTGTKTATRISVALVMVAAVCALGLAIVGLIISWIRS